MTRGHALTPADFPDPPHDIGPEAGAEQSLVLGGGCFWCTEAVYLAIAGVKSVVSGYAGGTAATANYDAVCSGATDHAEVIRITFDASQIRLGELLKVFFAVAHDPTTLNRQGNDRGRQYRSAVFYADEAQRNVAADYIQVLDAAGAFPAPIVTTLEPLTTFYPAEAYHQDYAARNPGQPYVQFAALPKVEKLGLYFPQRLKRD
ncbi:peptide-methionine (S)-S-oxide reductase MsrA [Flagellatimonas centrodinii]|uniref:peptide-methionine (S)-S-oxide reductase MsrA n=1 Tax=Flagellatimonas centrodinii TaxID=2806210 RepID=UPI001FEFF294|nr:peptide-methionine (S)-S-oxide reductase MsrA [Flagellatimonas centrodinii]ULQ46713.1 peptide-methionine (S)-S-oxide reductase MsrA [Flagellatimonas centrodinii]